MIKKIGYTLFICTTYVRGIHIWHVNEKLKLNGKMESEEREREREDQGATSVTKTTLK